MKANKVTRGAAKLIADFDIANAGQASIIGEFYLDYMPMGKFRTLRLLEALDREGYTIALKKKTA